MAKFEPAPKPDPMQNLARQVGETLAQSFGCRFVLYVAADPPCRRSSGGQIADRDSTGRGAELSGQAAVSRPDPFLVERSQGGYLLVIPVRHNGRVRINALAEFDTPEPDLLTKLARLSLREFNQRKQLSRRRRE